MAAVMMTTSAFAMSPALDADGWRDYTTLESAFVNEDTMVIAYDAISDWDYFWGTTLNPANTGWNDFWFACQDDTQEDDGCAIAIFVGTVSAIAAPLVIIGASVLALAAMPAATTVAGPVLVTGSGTFIYAS